jgi:predicted transcriptional regulator
MKQKTFIFKYDPYFSPKRMFNEFKEAIDGKKRIQSENVMIANDLSTIHRIISKARLKVFASIKAYQPANVHELAQLLHRDYTNVWRDCQVLANCGIIELREQGKETQPIVLYKQIVLDFPVNKEILAKKKETNSSVQT